MIKRLLMNNLSPKLLLAIISFLFIGTCFAEIYKWTDSKGIVHFGEQPPSKGKSESIIIDVVQSSSAEKNESEIKQKKIVMYGTKWYGYCEKARAYFKKKGLAFIEYDVESRPSKRREFKSLGGTGYPLILIGKNEKMKGFNVSRFERLYNI